MERAAANVLSPNFAWSMLTAWKFTVQKYERIRWVNPSKIVRQTDPLSFWPAKLGLYRHFLRSHGYVWQANVEAMDFSPENWAKIDYFTKMAPNRISCVNVRFAKTLPDHLRRFLHRDVAHGSYCPYSNYQAIKFPKTDSNLQLFFWEKFHPCENTDLIRITSKKVVIACIARWISTSLLRGNE